MISSRSLVIRVGGISAGKARRDQLLRRIAHADRIVHHQHLIAHMLEQCVAVM